MAKDPDSEYLSGCLFVAAAAILTLLPPIFFVSTDVEDVLPVIGTNAGLQRLFSWSAGYSALFGLIFSRLGGLAGAFGTLGGYLCGAAYWFLTIQQTLVKTLAKEGHPTEYPDSTVWLVPLAWLGIGIVVSFLPMLKNPRLKHKES